MRRWPTIELVVTLDAALAPTLQAVLQARSMQTVSSSDSDSEGDFFTGAGVMDATVVEGGNLVYLCCNVFVGAWRR